MAAGIVGFADKPFIPDSRIREKVFTRKFHDRRTSVCHIKHPFGRRTFVADTEVVIDGGILIVQSDGPAPSIPLRRLFHTGGGKPSAVHTVYAEGRKRRRTACTRGHRYERGICDGTRPVDASVRTDPA